MLHNLIFPLLLMIANTLCAHDAFELELSKFGYTKHQLIKKKSLLYSIGSLDGKPSYFIVDTGATRPALFADGIKKLGLTPQKTERKKTNAVGTVTAVEQVQLKHIKIGNISLPEMTTEIMEQPFENEEPTVVVGNDFLMQHQAILDLRYMALYLRQSSLATRDQQLIKQWMIKNNHQQVPLTQLALGHCIIPVQINDAQPVYLLFDTGTGETTVADNYASHLALQPKTAYTTQAATDGTITFADITLKKMIINPLNIFFDKPIELIDIHASTANIGSMAAILHVVGIFGLTEMERLNMIIDMGSKSIYIPSQSRPAQQN